jgi:hypothetical protein
MRLPHLPLPVLPLLLTSSIGFADVQADVGGTSGIYTETAGGSVVLDASGSDTSDCSIAFYSWSFEGTSGAAPPEETAFDTDPTATIDLSEIDGPDEFEIQLTLRCRMVDEESGAKIAADYTDLGILVVVNAAPQIETLDYEAPIYEGDEVDFSITVTDAEPEDLLHITWTFSDGEVLTGEQITKGFDDNGVYDLEVLAEDDDAGIQARNIELNVMNVAPSLSCEWAETVQVGDSWSVTPSAEDPGDDTLTWSVEDLPEGADFEEETGALRWWPTESSVGLHALVLTVEDEDGGSASRDIEVEVVGQAAPADTGSPDSGTPDTGWRDTGETDDSNRDSGQGAEGAQILAGSGAEIIGCSCDQRGLPPLRLGWIFLIAYAGLRRRG